MQLIGSVHWDPLEDSCGIFMHNDSLWDLFEFHFYLDPLEDSFANFSIWIQPVRWD